MPPVSRPAPPHIFDRALVARHMSRRPDAGPDFVVRMVSADLEERLATISRRFTRAAILGPDASVLPGTARTAEGEVRFERFSTLLDSPGQARVDPEEPRLPASGYDLIVSLLDLQIVDDVPGFLAGLRRHLDPDGLFLAAALGGNSLSELRRAWLTADAASGRGAGPRVAPMIDLRDAGALLQAAGFALPVTDVETHIVRHADPLAAMRELKALGAANPLVERPRVPVTRATLAAALAAHAEIAGDPDGRVRTTLEIVWMSGWAPDPGQQKPLRPGSAKTRLSDVLGDRSRG